ncbi:substrate-binding domain-containing protein [Coraliomargarita sp. SDUM461004]|uniref:Substrate-binding domain-containing protein n=1 Tax=Thalassobacterium sedimentorum TaxID=3041258 RepID=A0ABU1AGL8_9BACT|nr:substrate-binding domain-containing protein [Coraliomargarita sp. SDUM461004]MDQ8192985.1 substrate-binding domain-containing protein [Coraliomargarita sp. SDUM461004]
MAILPTFNEGDNEAASSVSTPERSRVIKHLNKLVRQRHEGDRLPSVRQISKDCRVSSVTVQAVVEDLCKQGVIETRPRSGIFLAEGGSKASTGQVDILFITSNTHALDADVSEKESFHPRLLQELVSRCGKDLRSTRVHVVLGSAADNEMHDLISRVDFQSCVVIGMQNEHVNQVLTQHNVNFVHLFPSAPVLPEYCVAVNNEKLVHMQLEHLWSLGHKKIGLFSRSDASAYHRDKVERRMCYYRLMAESGLRVAPHWAPQLSYNPASALETFQTSLSDPADRPTALIVDDSSLPLIYQTLQGLGLNPGRDIALVGTDGLPMSAEMYPTATSLRIGLGESAALALDMLDSRAKNDKSISQCRWAPIELIVRETSCPPPVSDETPKLG